MHWLLIISFILIGTIIISISISNPLYRLVVKKKIKLGFLIQIIFRILLLISGVIIIGFGLYLHTIFVG